jgi:hypothetical protein
MPFCPRKATKFEVRMEHRFSPQFSNARTGVLRLTFEYNGNNVRLISSQRVRMTLPASMAPHPEKNQSGFWYELRDANERTLYHRVMASPIRFDAEVFSTEEKGSIRRQEVLKPQGAFVLLVPDTPEAESIVLFGSSSAPRTTTLSANELARFKLKPGSP